MIVACSDSGDRIRPKKNINAFCPCCDQPVIAKMGKQRVHHWAHREKSDCPHGRGMTKWHYRWIDRHFGKDGWEVEFVDGNRRYDCYHDKKGLVLEFQNLAVYGYILEKTSDVVGKGLQIKWIFHSDIFRSFRQTETHFEALSRQRLVILDILELFADNDAVEFYIDSLAGPSDGKSSKGLLRLKPTNSSHNIMNYVTYYNIRYVSYNR